jgi:predicted acylesterase/phospholipase RssA
MVAPKYLVIGSGSMAFFAYMGRMSMIDLTHVKGVSGASAGALLAFLWVVFDGKIPEMLDFSLKVPLGQIMKPNLKNFFNNFGLVAVGRIKKFVSEILFRKFKVHDMTFGELRNRRPVDLHVSAFCVERSETTYFSHETHPGVSVVDAVCASIAVPFLFSPVKIDEWRYIDGAVQESLPGLPFVTRHPDEVLALRFETNVSNSRMGHMFSGVMRLRHTYKYPTYFIRGESIDMFDFGADRLGIFIAGQKSSRLVNEASHPFGPHEQADPRRGDGDAQGVLLPPQAGVYSRETIANLRRWSDWSQHEDDWSAQEGHVDFLRVPPSRGHDEPSQGAQQGDNQGQGGAPVRVSPSPGYQHIDQTDPPPRFPHL